MVSSASSAGTNRGGQPQSLSLANKEAVMRNALRYTVSAKEYAALHKYILSRSRALRRRVPSVEVVNRVLDGEGTGTAVPVDRKGKGKATDTKGSDGADDDKKGAARRRAVAGGGIVGADDFNARAVRHSIRVFVATGVAMKLWGAVMKRLMGSKDTAGPPAKKLPFHKSPTFRLPLSLSAILLLYRLLFRFFTRLRAHLLDASAAPFRTRNPRTAATLTSPYAPALGASLAGLALGIAPAQQLRVSVAIYALFRALEFGWNAAEDGGAVWGVDGKTGKLRARPWWWGSWMLQPLAFGQLLHAAVFDRDCFPSAYGDFIFQRSPVYLHSKPRDAPVWPGTYEVVDALAGMAKAHWPPFSAPSLFPSKPPPPLAPLLAPIAPLTSTAHPLITSLACATLHPGDPSCARTYLTFWLRAFPPTARFFLLLYGALAIPRLRRLYHAPVATLLGLLRRAGRSAAFVVGALSTAWASLCLGQAWLPRRALAGQRFFLGGFAAGFWAWLERRHGRGLFLYSARASADSLWKVGVKRRWWRAVRGGEVLVFVLAVMLGGAVYERDGRAVREEGWRKGVSWVRGEGWRDWVVEEEEEEGEEEAEGEEGGLKEE